MKLHAGRQPDRDDLDILLAKAGIDTRAEALRIHERTYGDEPMTEESDQLPDRPVPAAAGRTGRRNRAPANRRGEQGKGRTR